MSKSKQKRRFAKATALLAVPAALAAVVSFANVKLPQASDDFNPAVVATADLSVISEQPTIEQGAPGQNTASAADRLFDTSWGSADPEVYALIALAFDSEPLSAAILRGVECRAELCRVSFDANAELPVRKLLPVQLAQSFKAMVTVHAGGNNQVYVDIPQRG